jgi:hypothetical protein
MKKIYLSSLALCFLAFSGIACAEKAPALHTLNVQGDEYTSACTPQNKTALQAQVTAAAWPLVETLLCEMKSASSRAYVAAHISKMVKYELSETGSADQTKKTVVNAELIDSLLSEGKAWNTDLIVENSQIVIKFMPNEACVRSRTLQLSKNTWKITELGEACD